MDSSPVEGRRPPRDGTSCRRCSSPRPLGATIFAAGGRAMTQLNSTRFAQLRSRARRDGAALFSILASDSVAG